MRSFQCIGFFDLRHDIIGEGLWILVLRKVSGFNAEREGGIHPAYEDLEFALQSLRLYGLFDRIKEGLFRIICLQCF